jgi:flagellar biosynthesis chaperone FliJ
MYVLLFGPILNALARMEKRMSQQHDDLIARVQQIAADEAATQSSLATISTRLDALIAQLAGAGSAGLSAAETADVQAQLDALKTTADTTLAQAQADAAK